MATENGTSNPSKRKGGKDKPKEDPLNSKNREMASTNSTLYTILGGTRHSWMMNSNALAIPNHPAPKIRVGEVKRKPALPSPPLAERTTATIKETTKNNSPNGAPITAPESVLPLPSPAPSEGQPSPQDSSVVDSISPVTQPSVEIADTLGQAAPVSRSQNESSLPQHPTVLDQPSAILIPMESIRSATRILEGGPAITAKRRKIDTITAPMAMSSGLSPHNMPSELFTSPPSNPPIAQTPIATHPAQITPSRMLVAPQGIPAEVPIPGRQLLPPAPVILPSEPLNVPEMIEKLNIFINAVGGPHAFNPSEWVRIDLVREAFNLKDWSFLHLHQLYCLSNGKKEFEDKFKLSPQRLTGFQLLMELLSSNECVSGRFLKFFTHFPPSTAPPWYASSVNTSINFLEHGQRVYHELRHKCLVRRVTPTPEELNHVALESQVIQRIIWRTIHSALNNGVATEYTTQAERLFVQEQLAYRHALQQQKEREQYARILANEQAIKLMVHPSPISFRAVHQPMVSSPQPNHHVIVNHANTMPSHFVSEGSRTRPLSQMPQSHQVYQQLMRRQSASLPLGSSPQQISPLVAAPPAQSYRGNTLHPLRLNDLVPNIGIRSPHFPPVAAGQVTNGFTTAGGYAHSAPPTPVTPLPCSPSPYSPSAVARAPVDHFISVVGFAVTNVILRTEQPCIVRRFEVPEQYIPRLSKWQLQSGPVSHSKRMVHHGSLIYRLRSVRYSAEETNYENDNIWVSKPVMWPEHAFVEINQEPVALRRKNHFGKDFVADVTNQIRPGINELKVAYFGDSNTGKASPVYALRLEILEAHAYPAMVSACLNQRLPKEQSVASIVSRLKEIQDDEISVESQDLLLKIACPLSQKLIKDPVRGRSCLHTDCFDLHTYLTSRPRKKEREPPSPDAWQCPWCRGDARPRELIVDEFVQEILTVINSMIAQGKVNEDDVKEVIVKNNGSWEIKKEDVPVAFKAREPKWAESTPEVITIDD